MVGKYLSGEYGEFKNIDPRLALPLYMLDQYTWSRDIGRPFLEAGGNIISNRYFTANVHQIAKVDRNERPRFRDWMWKLGYEDLGLLKPELVRV
jgi:hypothetical protein